MILSSGESLELTSKIAEDEGLEITVSKPPTQLTVTGKANKKVIIIDGTYHTPPPHRRDFIAFASDSEVTEAVTLTNSTVSVNSAWGGRMEIAAVARHPLLEVSLPVEAEMLPVWSEQTTVFGEDNQNFMSTSFSLVGDVRNPQQTLNREIYVNNTKILGIEFDQFTSKEIFYDHDKLPLLTITYDPAGLPLAYIPHNGADTLNISYDTFNRIDSWKWGDSELKYSYDRHGLLSEITSSLDGTQMFTYNDWNMLSKITLASQRSFSLSYDDDGGLRHQTLPSGTKQSYSIQPSLGC